MGWLPVSGVDFMTPNDNFVKGKWKAAM